MGTSEFLKEGRVAQKRRTHQALLDAGLRVVRQGTEPTLDLVAAEAGVSRATAYRYFPRIESLLRTLPLADLVAPPEEILGPTPSADPVGSALRTQRYFLDLAIDNEPAFRRLVQGSMEASLREDAEPGPLPERGSYRLRTLDAALAGLPDHKGMLEHLRVALVALSGIEALIAVKDVCGLDADAGRKSLEWAAGVLAQAALEQSGS